MSLYLIAAVSIYAIHIDKIVLMTRHVNVMMTNAWFTRLVYESDVMSTVGIYSLVTYRPLSIFPSYGRKVCLNIRSIVENDPLKELEQAILKKYCNTHNIHYKRQRLKLSAQLDEGYLMVSNENGQLPSVVVSTMNSDVPMKLLVIMSGVWESVSEYGITFKVIGFPMTNSFPPPLPPLPPLALSPLALPPLPASEAKQIPGLSTCLKQFPS